MRQKPKGEGWQRAKPKSQMEVWGMRERGWQEQVNGRIVLGAGDRAGDYWSWIRGKKQVNNGHKESKSSSVLD